MKSVKTEDIEMELMEFAFGEINDSSSGIFNTLGITLSKGERLFSDGDEGEELYIVLSGAVEIIKSSDSGEEQVIAVLRQGEILGEMSHFDERIRSATARALEKTMLLAFSRENFNLIFQLHPKWTTKLVQGLSERIRRTIASAEQSEC